MNSRTFILEDLRTCATPPLICPALARRSPLRSNQLTSERDSRSGSPFLGAFCLALRPAEIPAFPWPHARHGALQIGGLPSAISCPAGPSGHPSPGSDVIQDSDFPWEIAERLFGCQKVSVLRASGALRVHPFFFQPRTTRNA
jgi:hypothetical protein